MLTLLKYSFLALGGIPWLLLCYLLLSFISHLFLPALPDFWARTATGAWGLFSSVFALFFLPWGVINQGIDNLRLLYQQIPVKPVYLVASHLIILFAVTLLFLAAWAFFAGYSSTLMPYGVTMLVAVNIFSFGLSATALGTGILMLVVVLLIGKERIPGLVEFGTFFLAICLLLFQFRPNLFDLAALLAIPLVGLTEGAAIAGGLLLQTPWNMAWRNIIQISAVLILQFFSLTYMLSGKIDVHDAR